MEVFAGVGLILHAGDVGGCAVLEALATIAPVQGTRSLFINLIAPVEAVYGNVDDPDDPSLRRERTVTFGEVTVHVSHGHELGRPTPAVALARYAADVVVFGHTHRAVVAREAGRVAVNPGAAGPRRFDIQPTVATLTIAEGSVEVEIISLA